MGFKLLAMIFTWPQYQLVKFPQPHLQFRKSHVPLAIDHGRILEYSWTYQSIFKDIISY